MKKKTKSISNKEPHGMGFYCDDLLLKKIDYVAAPLQWTRNAVIMESISHIINLVEQFDNRLIPNFLILTRALQHSGRYDFHQIGTIPKKPKKVKTGITIHPILLKKIDHIIISTGYSRNSFINECVIHALNIIEDQKADPIPNVVKICRTVATPVKLEREKEEKPKASKTTLAQRLRKRIN